MFHFRKFVFSDLLKSTSKLQVTKTFENVSGSKIDANGVRRNFSYDTKQSLVDRLVKAKQVKRYYDKYCQFSSMS